MLLDFVLVVGLVGWLVNLGLQGSISAQGVAFCLIGLVFLVAITRSQGIDAARWLFRIGVPIASLATFIVVHGNGDLHSISEIAGAIGGLIFAIFGLYLVFRAVFGRRSVRTRNC